MKSATPSGNNGAWPENLQGDALFRWAMRDVKQIPPRVVPGSKPRVVVRSESDPFETVLLNELWNVVGDLQSEYIEASHPAVSRTVMRKLRRGEFSVRAQCDLHGMTQKEARDEVLRFIKDSARRHLGCVRIIHGKGNNSQSKTPILKARLQEWLFGRRLSRYVLAYASARPCDGGTGAIYVLLRKV
ncbi:MAG TPA: Smr/MutS family protein [Acidobacteriota bacterium]